jgi:hypothetical protein
LWRPERHGARLRAEELAVLFLPAIPRVILLVFLLVSAAIGDENYFTFKWLWQWSSIGQGHQAFACGQMGICATSAPCWGKGRQPRLTIRHGRLPIAHKAAGFGSLSEQTVLHCSYTHAGALNGGWK